jgi:hypothetical protein
MARRNRPAKGIIQPLPATDAEREALRALAKSVKYVGHPHHKANPLDYNLTPPADPRPKKTWCDSVGEIRLAQAQELLRHGIEEGLVSSEWEDGRPKRVWSVDKQGRVFEAKHGRDGNYHGFPLETTDAFAQFILDHINAAAAPVRAQQ